MLPFVFCDCTTPKGEKGVGTLMKRRSFNFLSLHEIETNLILHNVCQKRVCVNTCVVSNHVAVHTPNPGETRNLNPPFPASHGSFLKVIVIYAIVSRDVLMKQLRCRSSLDLGEVKIYGLTDFSDPVQGL